MTAPCTVALIDSGVGANTPCHAATRIEFSADGDCAHSPALHDQLGHGDAIARIILTHAPQAALVSAQVFHDTLAASPALIAEGVNWARIQGARLIVLALGVRADRTVLRSACQGALASGCILLAASPARGPDVFPAQYDGVIRAMGDARCGAHDISALMSPRAHFGAPPLAPAILGSDHPLRGASCAAAHVAGRLAALLETAPHLSAHDLKDRLAQTARFHGPERRSV